MPQFRGSLKAECQAKFEFFAREFLHFSRVFGAVLICQPAVGSLWGPSISFRLPLSFSDA
jgi:hypothetical protein